MKRKETEVKKGIKPYLHLGISEKGMPTSPEQGCQALPTPLPNKNLITCWTWLGIVWNHLTTPQMFSGIKEHLYGSLPILKGLRVIAEPRTGI